MWPQYNNVQTLSADVVNFRDLSIKRKKKSYFMAQKYIDKIVTLYGNVKAIVNQASTPS